MAFGMVGSNRNTQAGKKCAASAMRNAVPRIVGWLRRWIAQTGMRATQASPIRRIATRIETAITLNNPAVRWSARR